MRLRRTPPRRLDDRTVEALLAGRAPLDARPDLQPLADALTLLAAQRPATAPASERLERMLTEGVHPVTAPLRTGPVLPEVRRTTHWRAGLATLAALATVSAGLVGAASANALPAPAQRAVAYVVEALSPLTLPVPKKDAPTAPATRAPKASPRPTDRPAPTAAATASPRPKPAPSPRLSGSDVVVLPPPSAEPDASAESSPSAEPEPSPTDEP